MRQFERYTGSKVLLYKAIYLPAAPTPQSNHGISHYQAMTSFASHLTIAQSTNRSSKLQVSMSL